MKKVKSQPMPLITITVTAFLLLLLMSVASASESYEEWRHKTGYNSVALFYIDQGLEKTCHGFWARKYLETNPESSCFKDTTVAITKKNEKGNRKKKTSTTKTIKPIVVTPLNTEDNSAEPEKQPTSPIIEVIAPEKRVEKPKPILPTTSQPPTSITLWVVQEGEHLWGISAHKLVYGDPYQWPLLYKYNRHQIRDADLIQPGQILKIERDLTRYEVDRAIEHARTRGTWQLGLTEVSDIEYLSRERRYP